MLGGFDPTELLNFHRQKSQAEWIERRLKSLGLTDSLERLTTALLDLQATCRHRVCREQAIRHKPGPIILKMLRPELGLLAREYFPESREVDEQFCLGILWWQTDLCPAWWHGLNQNTQEITA